MSNTAPVIYHERQRQNLCGLHAVNNLLQKPEFTQMKLNQIGADIFRQFQFSRNEEFDSSGNYSINVIQEALRRHNIELVHINAGDLQGGMTENYVAFLLHYGNHWFVIRKIGSKFWNLNSFFKHPRSINSYEIASKINKLPPTHQVFVARLANDSNGQSILEKVAQEPTYPNEKLKYYWNLKSLESKKMIEDKMDFSKQFVASGGDLSYEDPAEKITDDANCVVAAAKFSGKGHALGGGSNTQGWFEMTSFDPNVKPAEILPPEMKGKPTDQNYMVLTFQKEDGRTTIKCQFEKSAKLVDVFAALLRFDKPGIDFKQGVKFKVMFNRRMPWKGTFDENTTLGAAGAKLRTSRLSFRYLKPDADL
eukprot:maker-scaffold_1-snap-gene-1.34-mRNA-1 protein AED:0.00 eAED:0.00 QI:388/1/1/1/0.5/0.33/3/561/364